MEVRAAVGSADFRRKDIHGQVDGLRAQRSPGSALKPFIYALALDEGLIHPNSLLKDAPASFDGYDPENFDHNFAGPIKATDALDPEPQRAGRRSRIAARSASAISTRCCAMRAFAACNPSRITG